jgi:hypothetical protein
LAAICAVKSGDRQTDRQTEKYEEPTKLQSTVRLRMKAEHVLRLTKLFSDIIVMKVRRLAYYFSEKYNFPRANIFNREEMGMYTVQKQGRILGPKG